MWQLFLRVLTEFNQGTSRGLGVQEGDIEAFGATTRLLVEYTSTFFLNFGESGGNAVFDAESDVLNAATTAIFLDKLSDSTFRACGLEKFNLGFTDLEEGGFYVLVFNFLDSIAFETE